MRKAIYAGAPLVVHRGLAQLTVSPWAKLGISRAIITQPPPPPSPSTCRGIALFMISSLDRDGVVVWVSITPSTKCAIDGNGTMRRLSQTTLNRNRLSRSTSARRPARPLGLSAYAELCAMIFGNGFVFPQPTPAEQIESIFRLRNHRGAT